MHRIKYKTQFSLNKKPENALKAEEVNQIYQSNLWPEFEHLKGQSL